MSENKVMLMHRKVREGTVISAKMNKTIIVVVERKYPHPRYKKFVTARKKYAVHDEMGCEVGDLVRIRETRPMSKTKRFRVFERLGRDGRVLAKADAMEG